MLRFLERLHDLFSPFKCLWALERPIPPIQPLPDLPLEIWLEIFQWSTYIHASATIEPLDPFTLKSPHDILGANTPLISVRTKCALVLVCRAWRRVAIQILYQHIVIRSPTRAALVLQVLRDSHSGEANYGHWTRHIELYTHARGSADIRFLQTIHRIFQYCPRLRMLTATWRIIVPKEFLAALATHAGPTLQGLCWDEQKHSLGATHASLSFLASFRSLRILDLRNFVGDGILSHAESSHPTLPCLTHIILSTHGPNVAVATAFALPALHTLTLHALIGHPYHIELITKLLAAHGASLTTVHLPTPSSDHELAASRLPAQCIPPALFLRPDVCPSLDTLTFDVNSPALDAELMPSILEPHVHPTLRRVALYGVRADAIYPSKGPNETQTHLRALKRARFPNLETVRTAGFLVDADTDTLARDVFIWWGDKFERDGVDFQDGEGVVWVYDGDGDGAEAESSE